MNVFNHIINPLKSFIVEIGDLSYFSLRFFKEVFRKPYEFQEFLKQCFYIGNRSLFLVTVTGLIIGLVFTLQTRPTLQEFGAVSMIPAMVSISIIREIGPIITGLICTGKVGSGIGAEIGSMRVTEQIDAMEVSGTNPFKYLVITRILATTMMLPVLVMYSDFIAIFGSYLVETTKGNVTFTLYFNQVFNALEFSDLIPATIKSFFFGFAIGLVGCFKGYYCNKGTEGVGIAANSAVVYSSVFLFIIDFIAVLITNIFVQ